MMRPSRYNRFLSIQQVFRIKRVVYIALFWTLLDIVVTLFDVVAGKMAWQAALVRMCLVFVMSLVMGYLFAFAFRQMLPKKNLILNFFFKALLVLLAALFMNFVVNFISLVIVNRRDVVEAITFYYQKIFTWHYLATHTLSWMSIFIVTQLFLEINDKYAPGVFVDILAGKYKEPKVEKRIIAFMDLKDSTPIAEKLGHQQYFLFIRMFIRLVSEGLITHDAIIYQYVGDEIVASWPDKKQNYKNAIGAVIAGRRNIQKESEYFRREFGIIPEFRVGMHVGDVTVGEIGIIKKDLAMSGDTMNTAARIRGAGNDLFEKFIVSEDFIQRAGLKNFQYRDLGEVDLKGKSEGIKLYGIQV